MATEQTGEMPSAETRGEALAPATPEGGTTSSDSPTGAGETTKAPKAKKAATPRATAAKGTTGSALANADGKQTTAADVKDGNDTSNLRTITGSDETTTDVYSGEPPMSQEDSAKAAKGRDPLKTVVPDGADYGNMGIMHMAKNTEAPIGPTGNVPTGSAHAVVKQADKLDKPLAEAREGAEKASA